MHIVDLTLPIENHFRWPVRREVRGSHARGDTFEVTAFTMAVHAFTHVDAPRHVLPGGSGIDATPLVNVVGDAAVIDLVDITPNQPIDAQRLAAAASHLVDGDIVIMRTGWDRHRSIRSATFWTEAPYMTRDAARWLLERRVRCVAFDFPQDYAIRLSLDGVIRPLADNPTHDVLLANGVTLIEYLTNTLDLAGPRTFLCAAPLKLPGADGAPARVFAIETD